MMNRYRQTISAFLLALWLALPVRADTMSSYETALTNSFASYQCGDFEKATRHMEYAAKVAKKINALVEAGALQNLAYLYHLVERYEDALVPGEQAVALFKQAKGGNHRDHIEALAALAYTHIELGNLTEAEEMLERALSMIEAESGRDYDLARATIQTYLADIYLNTGRADEAPALYRQALALMRDWPMLASGVLALAYDRLAWAEVAVNENYALAEQYFRWTVEVFETYWSRQKKVCENPWSLYGTPMLVWPMDEDPDRAFYGRVEVLLADSLTSLAAVQYRQEKLEKAARTMERLHELVPARGEEGSIEGSDWEFLEEVIRKRLSSDG